MSRTLRSLVHAVAPVTVPQTGLLQVSQRYLARGTRTGSASPGHLQKTWVFSRAVSSPAVRGPPDNPEEG